MPGVALAARYVPSAEDVVGGDWYDLVPLPGGRVAIVLGDVAGHGLAAAAITAQLRHALRAHLLRAAGPGAALDGLNQVIAALLPGEMATAVIAELDPATGEVVVANAGHLPVLHATAAGAEYVHGRPRAGARRARRRPATPRRGCSWPATTGCCCSATAWSSGGRVGPGRRPGGAARRGRGPGRPSRRRCSTPCWPR